MDEQLNAPEDIAILGPGDSSTKKNILQRFLDAFTKTRLYTAKEGEMPGDSPSIVDVLDPDDTLINTGYFIKKSTLESLANAIESQDGGVWINFAVGQTNQRGDELQLVLTATETQDELEPDDLGKYCVTTAQVVWPTDLPYTGITSPKRT